MRAASGPTIGLGHAARTLSVAEELLDLGLEPRVFVDDAETRTFVESAGVSAEIVDADGAWLEQPAWSAWFDTYADVAAEVELLGKRLIPSLLVENRTPARERAAISLYPSLHHQDDAWDREHPDRVRSGAEWIPMRRAVLEAVSDRRDIDLLITFGGSDPLRLTERVLAVLPDFVEPHEQVVVALGPHMLNRREAIESLADGYAAVVVPGSNLPRLMARARTGITAVATTLNELAFHGVRALVLANFERDANVLEYHAKHGPHVPVGFIGDLDGDRLIKELVRARVQADPAPVRVAGLGAGASRLADLLFHLPTSS